MSWKRFALIVLVLAAAGWAFARVRAHPAEPTARHSIDKVLLVTIDALRRDRLGLYGYKDQPTSPALDAWAREAIVFDGAVAPAPWTIASLGALFTGHYPAEIGAYTNSCGISPDFTTLPELFQKAGFLTASFSTHRLLIGEAGGFRRGFDEVHPESIHPILKGEHKMPYAKLEPDVLHWLDDHADEQFFLWIHDMDTHEPATTGNPYIGRPGWLRYEAEVHSVDDAIAHLIVRLQALGIWDDTLVVFTADHGEAFDEHGILGHQDCMYDEVLRIPLMMHVPGIDGARRIAEPVDHLDLFSTLLDLAGIDPPAGSRGKSFAPLIRGERHHLDPRYLFASRYHFEDGHHEIVVRDRHWKLLATAADPNAKERRDERRAPVWDPDALDTRLELYNLMVDPGEVNDLYDEYPDLVARMQKALEGWHNSTQPPARIAPELDEASKETLRGLGYKP